MTPTQEELFQAVDATWPAFSTKTSDIWTLREGRNAGQRVSAASTTKPASAEDVRDAAAAMRQMGQNPLFMIRGVKPELDDLLGSMDYKTVDPVDLLMMRCADMAQYDQGALQAIFTKDPLAIQAEIWRDGGVDEPRLAVMRNVGSLKTCIFGRYDNRAAGTSFLGCHQNIAMIHAVEVCPNARRKGVAEMMMRGAAWWALQHGMEWFACLVTSENTPAQRLYRKMGMEVTGQYHYRKWIT